MIEIKTATIDPQPAKAGRDSHRVGVDGYEVSWYGNGGSVFCFHYTKGGDLTSADFRKFSVLLGEIADMLDSEIPQDFKQEATANG
jgi:hypothetical protein